VIEFEDVAKLTLGSRILPESSSVLMILSLSGPPEKGRRSASARLERRGERGEKERTRQKESSTERS